MFFCSLYSKNIILEIFRFTQDFCYTQQLK